LRGDSSARGSAGTASPNTQASASGIARTASPVPPAGQSRLQLPGASAGRAAGKSGLASPVLRTGKLDGSPAHGTPPSADATGPPRPPRPKIKRRLNVGALAEGALILGAGAYACWELASSPSARVRSHVLGECRRIDRRVHLSPAALLRARLGARCELSVRRAASARRARLHLVHRPAQL
jgi:hypothetical protein